MQTIQRHFRDTFNVKRMPHVGRQVIDLKQFT